MVILDDSWDQTGRAGKAFLAYNQQGRLKEVAYASMRAKKALQAEAMALKRAIPTTSDMGGQQGVAAGRIFYADCRNLVQAVNGPPLMTYQPSKQQEM